MAVKQTRNASELFGEFCGRGVDFILGLSGLILTRIFQFLHQNPILFQCSDGDNVR